MVVTIVDVYVKIEHINDFIEASRLNHEASVLEEGNRRFDILQDKEQTGKFVLYEAYDSEADAAKHKETSHYELWRETVADWMSEPRKSTTFNSLYPA